MIQNFSAYSFAPNVEQLILERKSNDRVDPLILFHCFGSVHRGDQTNLAKARKACGLDKITDSKVLPVTCLEKSSVSSLGLQIRVDSESKNPTSTDSSSSLQFHSDSAFSSNQAWVASYIHRLRNDLANLTYNEGGIEGSEWSVEWWINWSLSVYPFALPRPWFDWPKLVPRLQDVCCPIYLLYINKVTLSGANCTTVNYCHSTGMRTHTQILRPASCGCVGQVHGPETDCYQDLNRKNPAGNFDLKWKHIGTDTASWYNYHPRRKQ